MASAFFGLIIGKDKTPLPSIPVDDEIDFKLTNAALSSPTGKSEKVQLYIHYGEEKYLVCVLNSDTIPQATLELVFSSDIPIPVAFSIEGGSKATRVHLTGFCSRSFDAVDMDSDEDSDVEEREFLDRVIAGEFGEDSEEEESESDSDDDGPKLGIEEIKEEEPEPEPKKKKKVAPSKSKGSLMDIDEEPPKKKKQENQNKGNQNKGNQNKGN
eukprot:CAMPEP_0201518794 /NCGR_PEP_ID=MMETSP0161_2-20130828/9535_1 /ASSEMBLY_ACC=CAM_ASM_000251 /TAXON_ID=180227 /ORGANISM="Neoparamoeba aestuarina, Strain SoJaBio B1-5/56/2" /LENGTH=212 /DNA_ID=CAMNT_0047916663 /DNA_START=63 /DNA_END=698 /DNA_ORIENTATION=+